MRFQLDTMRCNDDDRLYKIRKVIRRDLVFRRTVENLGAFGPNHVRDAAGCCSNCPGILANLECVKTRQDPHRRRNSHLIPDKTYNEWYHCQLPSEPRGAFYYVLATIPCQMPVFNSVLSEAWLIKDRELRVTFSQRAGSLHAQWQPVDLSRQPLPSENSRV